MNHFYDINLAGRISNGIHTIVGIPTVENKLKSRERLLKRLRKMLCPCF